METTILGYTGILTPKEHLYNPFTNTTNSDCQPYTLNLGASPGRAASATLELLKPGRHCLKRFRV